MANALLTPTLWSDQNGTSPPASWTGAAYDCMPPWGGAAVPSISQIANAHAGDIVAFTLDVLTPDTSDVPAYCEVVINGAQVFLQSVAAVGSFPFTSAPIPAGVPVSIDFYTVSGGNPYLLYSGDFRITPLSASGFWTDFLACSEAP